MSTSGLVSLLARTLASRYPVMRLKTDPPLSDEEHAENMRVEEEIHALADHVKETIVEESTTHYALWFYSVMFGLDNLGDLADQLTERLWYQVEFPEIPKRAIVPCETVKYTCIAIGPGLIVAGGGTIVGILESSGVITGERGQRQGVLRKFDIADDENSKRATISGISVVTQQIAEEHKDRDRGLAVIALCWNDGHGSSYLYCGVNGSLTLIKQLRKNDYIDCPPKHMSPVFNSYGRVTYRGGSNVVTFPVYRPFVTPNPHNGPGGMQNYMQVNSYDCYTHREGSFFTCDSGLAAWYNHPKHRVSIMYVPIAEAGSAEFHQQQDQRMGLGHNDPMGFTISLDLSNASAMVSSLHLTKYGTLFVGFTNGGILAFQIPVDREYGYMGYRAEWFKQRAQREHQNAAVAGGLIGGLGYEEAICNMDTGFDGVIENISSDPETGQRITVIFSSGFMQVYDIVSAEDPEVAEAMATALTLVKGPDRYGQMIDFPAAAPIALIPVRTIDLLVLSKVLDERQLQRDPMELHPDISRPEKRARLNLAAIEASAGLLPTVISRHRAFAGTKKIVCMDARRIVYYNVDMQILSVWSFGPCI